MDEKLLSVEDVYDYLGIGRDMIYKRIAARSLPAFLPCLRRL
jgi:predicted DNA-binding transcriptional regulator AlpA